MTNMSDHRWTRPPLMWLSANWWHHYWKMLFKSFCRVFMNFFQKMWTHGFIYFIGYKNYTKTQEILCRRLTVLHVAYHIFKLCSKYIHSYNKQCPFWKEGTLSIWAKVNLLLNHRQLSKLVINITAEAILILFHVSIKD